ncbi:YitT family protein [Miniphocaeibacter massiliensis]|uniref:YitT family protein n=1 Tax=Miniphocaeibacter massiliensis TaxID=2041841 RepID=UPI000C1BC397|nr:YitT family protein [Miniphocaeibacter massiliensis]
MKNINKEYFYNLFAMILGTFLIAFGINIFFIPFEIVSGGMNGVSVLLYHLFGISADITLLVSNFPLLLLSLLFLGKKYTLNTVFCSFLLPVFVKFISFIKPFEGDAILAAIFGGLLTGAGIGIAFRVGASTGGTAIIQQILHDYLKVPLGTAVVIIDGLVLMSAFIFFDVSTGLYSLISLFIIGKMVDIVQSGGRPAKTCFIISEKTEELIYELTIPLYLGVTILDGKGAFSRKDKDVLLCTFPEKTIVAVKKAIYKIDPKAFCIIVDTREVLGNRWGNFIQNK